MKQKGEMCVRKRKQVQNIWLISVLSGVGCLVLATILSLPTAKLMEAGTLPMKAMKVTAYVILGLSALTGAVVTAIKAKQKRLLFCLITATVFFLAVAILNGVLQKGQFRRIGETALIIYAVSVAAGLLCSGRKKRY